MANHSSSSSPDPQKPHKQIDLSLLLEISTKLGIPRKLSDLINNNKSSTNTNTSEKDSNPQKFGDFQPINRYHFPNCYDKDEIGLPCLEHCLFRFQWQSNFSSPIEQRLLSGDNRILDVGCGQGAWILDMAKEYHPTNTYIGIDILPDFPDEDLRLPNTGFIQCDFRCGIPFPDSTFDFVYERFVVYSDLTDAQWKYLFSEMKRVLKPGGYLEIMEYHADYENPGPITQIRNAEVLEYLDSKGINPDVTIESINQMMQSTPSLTDFQRQDKFGPIGRWGGEFGLIMLESYEMSRKALSRQFKSGLMEIELDDLIESITKEFDENKTKLGNFRCFAQKKACFLYD